MSAEIWRAIQTHLGIEADGVPGNVTAQAVAKALGLHSVVMSGRTVSASGRAMIASHEGLRLKAYLCPANVWTIGYGHTGKDVTPNLTITKEVADHLLAKDLRRFEAAVNDLCKVTTQNQFDALVSFAFNLGENALEESTLRRKHNDGDYAGAKAEFGRWVNAGGKKLAGLVNRRAEEAELYGS